MGRHNDATVRLDEIRQAELLVGLLDAKCGALTNWEQGFIAALTWFEQDVLFKVEELARKAAA